MFKKVLLHCIFIFSIFISTTIYGAATTKKVVKINDEVRLVTIYDSNSNIIGKRHELLYSNMDYEKWYEARKVNGEWVLTNKGDNDRYAYERSCMGECDAWEC